MSDCIFLRDGDRGINSFFINKGADSEGTGEPLYEGCCSCRLGADGYGNGSCIGEVCQRRI